MTKVWEVSATTGAILELADHLLAEGVGRVTVESTSDYWRGFFYLLEARGLSVQLVNARDVKNVPGRPKTDKLDAVWPAKLTERGMLQPSFVPPVQIRRLRDYTRLRTDLTVERTRYWKRLEKLLEDSLIKITTVARMLLDQIDALNTKIEQLTSRVDELLAEIPAARAPARHDPDPTAGTDPGAAAMTAIERLDEIPGIAHRGAQVILAEVGLDMTQFPTPAHLVSWARLCPRTVQSGPVRRGGRTGKGNPYLKGVLGEATTAAAKTDTFLGERYRRLVKRKGKMKALVAVAGNILEIVWHLPADPTTRYRDLGPGYHTLRVNTTRKIRDHVRGLEALGYTVTITAAA